MPIAQSLLPEFDHEMGTTRTLLEIVPEAHWSYKPHPKSMSLGQLASHIPVIVSVWGMRTLRDSGFDVNPATAAQRPEIHSVADLLAVFDEAVQSMRAALAETSDEAMRETWTLSRDGQTIFSLPRVAVLRSFIMNHIIHHRGQLSVYLRLQDVPLPSIYGPSADTPV
ncbi:MAG TPA: DinB family protein [Thermoanaerobaculia bacterium]|nr:DinB family protein [Thermoanaerobaculia bacterium]